MAKNQTKPLAPDVLDNDQDAIVACKGITTYVPQKAEFNQTALDGAEALVAAKEAAHATANRALNTARDQMVGAQWARHNLVLGMRTQVKAQFGEDSDELQAVGLKKKSEYKKGGRRKTTPPTP